MKKYIASILFIITFIFSCSIDDSTKAAVKEQANKEKITFAKLKANIRLNELKSSKNDYWDISTAIDKAYPIYIPGVVEPTYYEYKVVNGTQDAGFILVSVTEEDIEVPELAMEGLTLNEEYQNFTGLNKTRVIRYSWFESIAINPLNGLVVAAKTTTGMKAIESDYDSQQFYKNRNESYAAAVRDNKAVPTISGDDLKNYYSQITNFEQQRSVAPIKPDYTDTVYLRSKFANGHHTPDWVQSDVNGSVITSRATGCGPLAWAITLGYWSAFKGKPNLFGGLDIKNHFSYLNAYKGNCPNLFNSILELRKDLRAWNAADKATAVWPADMVRGTIFTQRKGYSGRVTQSNAHNYNGIRNEIASDRPVIMLINHVSFGFADHYVVVEGVSSRYDGLTNIVETRGYYVNYGSGGTRKWLYLINLDNFTNVSSLYDVYFISI